MSDYDVVIASQIAHVICGGDLQVHKWWTNNIFWILSEKGFDPAGKPKTQERIQPILMHNRPLRN